MIQLKSITFTYAGGSALSIRRNYLTSLNVPEWQPACKQPQDAPAAYSIIENKDKPITIQVEFSATSPISGAVQIKAEDGGLLGSIAPFTVTFQNNSAAALLNLSQHKIGQNGVQLQDVAWQWLYQDATGRWTQIGTTQHRIYVVLDNPKLPWQQEPAADSTQLPWTDVLDHACTWASGKTTIDDVAAAITQKVNQSIGLTYNTSTGATNYSKNNIFLCTQFLEFLENGPGLGKKVNCTDCATIVTTFSNILGCNLFAARMAPNTGRGFKTNKIIAIGFNSWAYPFPDPTGTSGGFSYHEVAWTGQGDFKDPLYDACLLVDDSQNPWNWTQPKLSNSGLLPCKMPFTTLQSAPVIPLSVPFTDQSYRERLATNQPAGIGACIPHGSLPNTQGGRRKVA